MDEKYDFTDGNKQPRGVPAIESILVIQEALSAIPSTKVEIACYARPRQYMPTPCAMFNTFLFLLMGMFLSGCFFRPEAIVAHPDAPFLIQEVKGHYAHVLVYDKVKNKMIDYGWVDMKLKFQGYTLSKYNWEKLISKRASNGQ